MKKIPTVFVRNPEDRRYVLDEVSPGCEWVLAGEGVATRKLDGTCLMLDGNGDWWARREVKYRKPAPANFVQIETDSETGKAVGWEPIAQSPFAKFHAEALRDIATNFGTTAPQHIAPGTYELIGPKINGNPEAVGGHVLMRHAAAERYPAMNAPQGYDELATVMQTLPWEGIVWHHPDGRMAKLKRKDFR